MLITCLSAGSRSPLPACSSPSTPPTSSPKTSSYSIPPPGGRITTTANDADIVLASSPAGDVVVIHSGIRVIVLTTDS